MLVAERQKWRNILAALHVLPVDRRISGQNAKSAFLGKLLVSLAHSGQQAMVRRSGDPPRRAHYVLPGFTQLPRRDVLASDVPVENFLIERVAHLNHHVVHASSELRRGHESLQ